MIQRPAVSTIHAVLDRNGLVKRRQRRRYKAQCTALSAAHAPHGLRCADYKGEFKLGNRRYCYPLTISEYRSRCLLAGKGLASTKSAFAFSVCEQAFRDCGLPAAIRTDNGIPLASPHALFGLSKLAAWWLHLGIKIQRIQPGCPQQNARHERVHLTRKQEATRPAAFNFLQQQDRFERCTAACNHQRPRQGPGGACPSDVYTPSARVYEPPPEPENPDHDHSVRATRCGRLCIGQRKINLSQVFACQTVGIREIEDRIWLVSFLDFDLGFFDQDEGSVEPDPLRSCRRKC